MAWLSDTWTDSFSKMDAKRLHAIGAIVFEWSRCEWEMHFLVMNLARVEPSLWRVLVGEVSNVELPEKAKSLCKVRPVSEDVTDYVKHICTVYDYNRSNRNVIVHAWPTWDESAGQPTFQLAKGHSFKQRGFHGTLEELRTAADQITICRSRLKKLNDAILPRPHLPLPEKPPLPARLWLPRPPDQPKRPRPPRSSPA